MVLLFLMVGGLLAQTPDANRYERDIRPLFVAQCYSCHSEKSGKSKGGLLLDSYEGLRKGGRSGPLWVAGKPSESLLYLVLTHEHEIHMPPKRTLDAASVANVAQWIKEGAELPPQVLVNAGGDHWAYQPRQPALGSDGQPQSIDELLAKACEEKGVTPAALADARTLYRRASWRLTGLPPSAKDVDEFVADPSPKAFAAAVDRWLASPRYAEHMARHWLDLARYADSNGADENHCMSEAWRYRDWVVQAFAKDLPYDQFLTQQIAGDLLPEREDPQATTDQHLATGFLVLGPKMLAEQDKDKLRHDVVDEQMDVLFRTAVGFSTSCARCHDHKFDPVSQEDYYALAGVFNSTKSLGNTNFVSRWMERDVGPRAKVEALEAWRNASAEAGRNEERARDVADLAARRALAGHFAEYLLAAEEVRAQVLTFEAEAASAGNLVADDSMWGDERTVVARSGRPGKQFAEFHFEREGRYELEVRVAAQESRPVRVLLDGKELAAAALGATTGTWGPEGQRWTALGPVDLGPGAHVLRLEGHGHFPHVDKVRFVPCGSQESAWKSLTPPNLQPVALRAAVDALEVANAVKSAPLKFWADWQAVQAQQGSTKNESALDIALATPAPRDAMELAGRLQTLGLAAMRGAAAKDFEREAKREPALGLVAGPEGLFWLQSGEMESLWPEKERAAVTERQTQSAAVAARKPADLPVGMVVEALPRKCSQVLARGNHLSPEGDELPFAAPPALSGTVPCGPFDAKLDGRVALAQWMTDGRHPLTARVMVNRVWGWLFGEGLVRTPSDFGAKGDKPDLPAVLDTLAERFVRSGWSVKSLVREIVLTDAWRRSGVPTPSALSHDPENELFSYMRPFRLSAEGVRDGLLFESGALDLTAFGKPLNLVSGQIVTNDQSGNLANYDSSRRSLWLPVVRNAMYDVFSIFDYVDANGPIDRRGQSIQPQQMLFFMNSAVARDAARRVAEQALASAPASSAREDFISLQLVQRRLTDTERSVFKKLRDSLLAQQRSEQDAWAAVAQVIMASTEWLHVD